MYARSPDEAVPPSAPSPFSVQLYPYHQQAFHHHYPPQDNPEPPNPQPRPRASHPSLSASMYPSPQHFYQGPPPPVPFARRRVSTLPQSNLALTNVYPHQPYPIYPVPEQYPTHHPPHHTQHGPSLPYPQPSSVPPVNHAPSYSPPLEPYAAAAASIGIQPHPVTSMPSPPPPPFQEHERLVVADEKPPLSPDDEHEFALALAMSQAEMLRKKNEEEKLSTQEDEELARALAESLQMAQRASHNHLFGGESSTSSTFAPSSHQNNEDLSPLQLPISLPSEAPAYVSASSTPKDTTPLNDNLGSNWEFPAAYNPLHEAGTSQLTSSPSSMPSATAASSYPTETLPQDRFDPLDNLPVYSDRLSSSLAAMESLQRTETDESRLVFDDEAYARQLLAEEEDQLRSRIEEKGRMEAERRQRPEPDKLPQYTSEGLLAPDVPPVESSGSSRRSSNAKEVPQLVQGQPARSVASASAPSSSQVPAQVQSLPQFSANEQGPPLQTVNSSNSISSSTQSGRPGMSQPGNQTRSHANSIPSAVAGPSNAPQLTRHSSAGVVNPNHFLDRELLTGVTIGFKPPVLSLKLEPMEDPMPNIISLPSKRCPPLHLQAPSWRHMLRLLARLSNTRIEPTIEAMSDTKAELKLRTVIQFVRPHPQHVNIWRTILWFTIDQFVPPNALGAARYTCGNPNVLPWSYTLSPLPTLLRGAMDTIMSKTYTVPATDAIPLPTLPITFPNLALYLHAVLEESRKHSRSDALNGIGKLGKMMQMSYPSVKEDDYDDDGPGRSSVADLFKRVMGRGNKDKNKGKSNNETYQMVIPFVSDGWG